MFQKILVISEPTQEFDIVLKTVLNLKKMGTESCLLLQCLGLQELNETVSTFITDFYDERLESQRQFLTEQGLTVTTRKTVNPGKGSINRIVEEENCSLIVAGTAERTMFGDLIFGGAATHLVYGASSIPLLLVKMHDGPAQEISDLTSHILFPTDFSDNAARAFEVVKQLVAKGVKKVTLLHVQDKARIEPYLLSRLEEFNRIDSARLQKMSADLKKIDNVDVVIRIFYGSPTVEILNYIDEHRTSIVVMGSQGRGFIKEIYLGSVSHNIARHAPVPVLLIPAERD